MFEIDLQAVFFLSISDNSEPHTASPIMGLYIHPTVRGPLSFRAGYSSGEVDLWNCVVWQKARRPIC